MSKIESIYSLSTQSYKKHNIIEYLKKAIEMMENDDTPDAESDNSIKYDIEIEIYKSYKTTKI
jgi:hypothetical protein